MSRSPEVKLSATRSRHILRVVQVVITVTALIASAVHLIWPHLGIDGILLGLLAIAIAPWLGSLFESIEIPGIFKGTYLKERVEKIEREVQTTQSDVNIAKGAAASAQNQLDYLRSVGVADINSASKTEELQQLIQRYDDIRRLYKSGPQRTQLMTDVVRHIAILSPEFDDFSGRP